MVTDTELLEWPLEAVRSVVSNGFYIRPKGSLGKIGWSPVPWDMVYVKRAKSEQDAIIKARQSPSLYSPFPSLRI